MNASGAGDDRPLTVVVDATCAQFGGIATYTHNLLRTWPLLFPQDILHVLSVAEVTAQLDTTGLTVHTVQVPRPAALGRPLVQTRELRRLVRAHRPDAVLATLPSTTVLRLPAPTVVVVYDLRHELRPEQFNRYRRALRHVSYGRGYQVADGVVAISRRSLDDVHRLHPATRHLPGRVVYLGADHVDRWPGGGDGSYAVAFGHHTNKNVDLVLDAWSEVVAASDTAPQLRITGLAGGARERVAAAVAARGLGGGVELLPFLDEDSFQRLFAGAGLIVFPSDFEGFGLPVVESMRLGKPVVVGPDEAVLEVAGGHAVVMSDWTARALSAAVSDALELSAAQRDAARAHARHFTWERTTRETRAALVGVAASSQHPISR